MEISVLDTIDFDLVNIRYILVESFSPDDLFAFMSKIGFTLIKRVSIRDYLFYNLTTLDIFKTYMRSFLTSKPLLFLLFPVISFASLYPLHRFLLDYTFLPIVTVYSFIYLFQDICPEGYSLCFEFSFLSISCLNLSLFIFSIDPALLVAVYCRTLYPFPIYCYQRLTTCLLYLPRRNYSFI